MSYGPASAAQRNKSGKTMKIKNILDQTEAEIKDGNEENTEKCRVAYERVVAREVSN